MKKSLKIFISSTVKDLAPEREMAARAIEALKLEALRAETLGSRPDTPAETCRQMVRDSDVFIGIYGGRYGYVPPGQPVSVTEMEFLEAREAGKDILVYVKDETQTENRQASFLSRADDFEGGYFRRPRFRTLSDLEDWIKEDLIALLCSRFVTSAQPQSTTSEDAYRSYVSALYGSMSFAGLAQTPSGLVVSFPGVFVSPRFRSIPKHDGQPSEELDVETLLSSRRQVILVCGPGSGKTTLLKSLAFSAAQGCLSLAGLERILPILVPLASVAASVSRTPGLPSLEHLIREFISSRAEPRFDMTIHEALRSGRALVLLDGLDEVASPDLRSSIASSVDAFCQRHPEVRVLVTTRPTGTDHIPALPAYEILPWNDEQIAAFVQRWSAAFTEELGSAAKPPAKAEELLHIVTTNSGLRELARSPLFLTLLCFLHRQGYRLPARRVELYDTLVRTMTGSWDRARSLSHTLPRGFKETEVDHLLATFAFGMTVRGLHMASVADVLPLESATMPRLEMPEQELAEVLHEIAQRSGLLVESAPGRFAFLHLSFREFFAAKALAWMNASEALAFITSHFYDPEYEETIRLALAWIDVRGGADFVVHAAEELLNAARG
ncbi:MAG: DUF4062 domain-containing protein [Thermodesulfovibrionales bacterium]|jgi:predicted NACHT family NTPase